MLEITDISYLDEMRPELNKLPGASHFGGHAMNRPMAYRPREAARELGIGRTTLYRRLKAGDIRASKLGRATVIALAEIERVLSAQAG